MPLTSNTWTHTVDDVVRHLDDLPVAPPGFGKLDMCSSVDGTLLFVRDGAGQLWWFQSNPERPDARALRIYVALRKEQILSERRQRELDSGAKVGASWRLW